MDYQKFRWNIKVLVEYQSLNGIQHMKTPPCETSPYETKLQKVYYTSNHLLINIK